MSKRIYKDFDLPNKHLSGEHHFVPPKARDEAEIERRRAQRPGQLVLQAQHRGIEMAKVILGEVEQPEDIAFVAETLAVSGLNTAWYLSGRGAPVQRRRLKLEVLATEDPEQRPSSYMLLRNAEDDFGAAIVQSSDLVRFSQEYPPAAGQYRRKLSQTIGHGSLTLSCVAIGDQIGYESAYLTDFDVQDMARQRGLWALEKARTLPITTPPSLAQLADADSDLSVFWRRNAPNGALEAYELAYEAAA